MLNANNVIFVTFNVNCGLHEVSVGKPFERMSNFLTVWFLKLNPNRFSVFCTPLVRVL